MKKKSSNKWLWIIAATVVVVILLIVVAKNRKQQATEVTTEKVERRSIIESVAANGKIQPVLEVKISPYISGEVVELFVREGNYVNRGDKLARIDPTLYISNLEQVEASVNSARANMANAAARVAQAEAQYIRSEQDHRRNEQLWKQQVISDADWDAIKASYQVATAEVQAARESHKATQFQVQNAEAALREARENLNRTTIYAPNDGTVSRLNVEAGERVTGASQFSAGTEIMRIANLSQMEVKVEVSENDIPRVKLNDTCIIEVDAYLNRRFKGLVTEIATSANLQGVSVEQVTNFEVKVVLLRESYEDLVDETSLIASPFRPGMSATVDIQTKRVDQVLSIPIQAVTMREDTASARRLTRTTQKDDAKLKEDQNLKEYVFVYSNDEARIREVKTGIQDNTYIEVVSGLDEDEEVITGPYRAVSQTLKNGEAVKKVEKTKLFSGS
jgi:HlyD family secretion protein